MAEPQDTEITLGTGKMLALFFGLVILCALFFAMGFSLGKSSVKPAADLPPAATTANGASRPSAVKTVEAAPPPSAASQNKAPDQKDADTQPAKDPSASSGNLGNTAAATSGNNPNPADPSAAPPVNGYYVQVAAVSKQEDADALVDALKKKQYPAFTASTPTDKLIHIQVGPFADIKDAESMRTKLVSDGYNPILKK